MSAQELSEPSLESAALDRKMRTGVAFWGLGNMAARVLRIAVWVVLGWLLDRRDFGLVAMTTAFMMVLQLLSEFGVGLAVIQKKHMPASYPSTAFWLNFGVSLVMVLAAWALAPWLAAFYREDAVTLLVRVSALGFLAMSLRTIPMALLRKRLQFGWYAMLDAAWQASSGALTIVFAVCGARYWSLVIPPIVMGIALAPLWFYLTAWRPSLTFDTKVFGELFAYSKNVVGASLVLLVLSNAGFVIAGHLLDSDQAGIFKFAFENSMCVVVNFAWLVGNVTMSGFAARQGQTEALRSSFGRVYDVLTAATLPLHVLLFVLADGLFSGVFPDKWAPAVPLFRIFLIYAIVRAMVAHVAPLYNAINRPNIILKYYAVVAVVSLPAMYFACRAYGLAGLAWATSAPQALGAVVILGITPGLLGWQAQGYFRRSMPFLVGSALTGAVGYGSARALSGLGIPAAAVFVVSFALGSVCYPVALYGLARDRFLEVIEELAPERIRTKYLGFLGRAMK